MCVNLLIALCKALRIITWKVPPYIYDNIIIIITYVIPCRASPTRTHFAQILSIFCNIFYFFQKKIKIFIFSIPSYTKYIYTTIYLIRYLSNYFYKYNSLTLIYNDTILLYIYTICIHCIYKLTMYTIIIYDNSMILSSLYSIIYRDDIHHYYITNNTIITYYYY